MSFRCQIAESPLLVKCQEIPDRYYAMRVKQQAIPWQPLGFVFGYKKERIIHDKKTVYFG